MPLLPATRLATHSARRPLLTAPVGPAACARLLCACLRFRGGTLRGLPGRAGRDRRRLVPSCALATFPVLGDWHLRTYRDEASSSAPEIFSPECPFRSTVCAASQTARSNRS